MKILITGISRGIGAGLVKEYLDRGDEVYCSTILSKLSKISLSSLSILII
jgi:NAD(P)-dependent dehydrogenase (short-subunit alcohol dehydrogenase family)